jgi:hypothetical protein
MENGKWSNPFSIFRFSPPAPIAAPSLGKETAPFIGRAGGRPAAGRGRLSVMTPRWKMPGAARFGAKTRSAKKRKNSKNKKFFRPCSLKNAVFENRAAHFVAKTRSASRNTEVQTDERCNRAIP